MSGMEYCSLGTNMKKYKKIKKIKIFLNEYKIIKIIKKL